MPRNELAERRATESWRRNDYREVVSELMRAYGRDVFGICFAMLNNRDDAEDVLQLTFMQTYEDMARFSGKSTWRTWLFSIARHRCLDRLKGARRLQARVVFRDKVPEIADAAGESSDPRVSEALMACLQRLSATVRNAVLLRYQAECTYAESAEILQEKPGTLQARVARALPKLRACLEEKGVSL